MQRRIAIVARAVREHDGVGSINLEVALAALTRGYAVTVVATDIDAALSARPGVTFVSIPTARVPTNLLRIIVFSFLSTLWLGRRRAEIDVVIASGFVTFARADLNIVQFVFAQWVRSEDIKDARIDDLRSLYHWLFSRSLVFFENLAFRRSRRLVACSQGVRDELIGRVGIDPNAIVVVPNGVRAEKFARKTPDRARFGLPADVPIVLFAGEIATRRKNLDVVLAALEHVPELHLAIAAFFDERNRYPGIVRKRGLGERVVFLGMCRDMPSLMSSVDFFALFSHYEPFGLVVLEAMASGLPPVTASNVGASTVMTADSGIVVSAPATTEAVATAFRTFASDRALRARCAAEASAVARQQSVERMTAGYLGEIDELMRA